MKILTFKMKNQVKAKEINLKIKVKEIKQILVYLF